MNIFIYSGYYNVNQNLAITVFFFDKYHSKGKEKFTLKCCWMAAGVGKTDELNPASDVRTLNLPP